MADSEQIFGDEPERLVGGHPVEAVEACEIHRVRKCSQRTLSAQVEIAFEITHRQLAQTPIHGFAVAASGVVRFGDCAPVAALLEDCDNMVGVVLGFEINYEWRISVHSQGRRRKRRAFETV